MAAEPWEITEDIQPETLSDRALLEHIYVDLHDLASLITPEARAMLESWLSNPALKWKARRDGRKNNQ